MVKLATLMGAKYRLKQRRKRLTHRAGHEGAHDASAASGSGELVPGGAVP